MLEHHVEPPSFEALAQSGIDAFNKGDLISAIRFFRDAVAREPSNASVLNSLGFCLYKQKEFEEANRHLSRAVKLDPTNSIAWQNLGLLRRDTGDSAMACEAFARAVSIDRTNTIYMRLFIDIFSTIQLQTHHEWIKNVLIFCLKRDNIELRELNKAWSWFYDLDAAYHTLVQWAHDPDDAHYPDSLNDPYLLLGLKKIRISSMSFERTMTALRQKILNLSKTSDIRPYQDFLHSLTWQAWQNEHVYSMHADEYNHIKALRKHLESDIIDDADYIARLYLYAAYENLDTLANAHNIYEVLHARGDDGLDHILKAHIADRRIEQEIRKTIPSISNIENSISQKVRDQYEDHPYPRWYKFYADDKPDPSVKSVLIAGCGTGQQSAMAAQNYPNASIYNVDLSLTSLAYAVRKSNEMGLKNMTFVQGDILELGQLNQQFDVVECIGVLHHMQDPAAGLRVLTSMLKTGGVLKLGLYSEAARRDIAAARDFIAEGHYGSTTNDVRSLRQIIADHADPSISDCSLRYDFFTTSSCRDLIMHVQEHRFTIPQIENLLKECGLIFLEFSLHRRIFGEIFRKKFPDPAAFYNLDKWIELEEEHPTFFSGMYNFSACHIPDFEKLRKKI
jgi:2-polyprenyl-3-methyl-5-hydroxy-6-metoxy-1,4-benzoquinol methylase